MFLPKEQDSYDWPWEPGGGRLQQCLPCHLSRRREVKPSSLTGEGFHWVLMFSTFRRMKHVEEQNQEEHLVAATAVVGSARGTNLAFEPGFPLGSADCIWLPSLKSWLKGPSWCQFWVFYANSIAKSQGKLRQIDKGSYRRKSLQALASLVLLMASGRMVGAGSSPMPACKQNESNATNIKCHKGLIYPLSSLNCHSTSQTC